MGGRGSNSMDRLKAGSHAVSQMSALKKAVSTAQAALTRAQNKQRLAHATVDTYDGDKRSDTYAGYVAAAEKADKAQRRALDNLSKAQSDLNKATEKAETKASKNKMPWETDPAYKNNKNAKLVWLMDHPKSKYNDPDFISGIKRIEGMADRGVSATQRRKALTSLAKRFNMSVTEARHFIAPEFLK